MVNGEPASRPRAGFYQRCGAALIDLIVVSTAFQVLVAVLFAATLGAVQTTSGFHVKNCQRKVAIAALPTNLDPDPPEHADSAVICRISFFGVETARQLTVSRNAKGGIDAEKASRTYMLDANDRPKKGLSLDWLLFPAFLLYLAALEHRFGTSIGKWMFGLRAIDTEAPERSGVPLSKAMIRNVLIWGWALPAASWLPGAGLLGIAWCLWILIQGDHKVDPIYDRIARTAVLRIRRPRRASRGDGGRPSRGGRTGGTTAHNLLNDDHPRPSGSF
jgi:uncharacterized RDD family membrane protein YckC